ncbi:hypothetical protein B0H19DRAFT_297274 [Mycena capillaripes]|nr:hypothetical protein B0H19DRAFT_297274 [Mycena capillaripes]
MRSYGSQVAKKKRKRSLSSEESPERERTSSLIRRSIALLTAIPEVPSASLQPLLSTLSDAYGSALSEEAINVKPEVQPTPDEEWNWELSAQQIARLSDEELTIWKDLLACRHNLRLSGIKLHPFNWKMPVVDLRQWEAHIPGNPGTPWEGGVYSLHVIFSPHSPERIPTCDLIFSIFCIDSTDGAGRFFRPLFHPNVFPSGTWGYLNFLEVTFGPSASKFSVDCVWTKTKQEDPERFAKLLRGIRDTIHKPDLANPQQSDAYTMAKYANFILIVTKLSKTYSFRNDQEAYDERVRAQAVIWKPDLRTGLAGRPILQPIKEES